MPLHPGEQRGELFDHQGRQQEWNAEPERIDREQAGALGHSRLGGRNRQDRCEDSERRETLGIVIDHLGDPASAAELVVRFELLVLDELGFGLDLTRCAATGLSDDLVGMGHCLVKLARMYAPKALVGFHASQLAGAPDAITRAGSNINSMEADTHETGRASISVVCQLRDRKHLDKLLDVTLEVTKKTKGENENVYFNRRIETAGGGDRYQREAGDALIPF